ncbi:hypothetical protein MUTS16_34840 [Escherichia coli]|nr:hypothetical protein MUTS16_34840 [Escherichia coli]
MGRKYLSTGDIRSGSGWCRRDIKSSPRQLANRTKWLKKKTEEAAQSLAEHVRSRNHPDATLTAKGFTQLSSATNSTSETLAATPKAVKAAYDLAAGKAPASHTHPWSQITGVPAASLTAKGTVQLSSATDSQSETEAATPKAVKAAYDLAAGKAPVSHTHPWSQITGVPAASLTAKGTVQLSSAINSTSEILAATPKAVKAAYDLANGKQPADATLTALAGLATAADRLPYFTGADRAELATLTAIGRAIIAKGSIKDVLNYLGLGKALHCLLVYRFHGPPPHRQQAGYSATGYASPKNNILFWSESTRPSVFPICAVSLSVDGTTGAKLIQDVSCCPHKGNAVKNSNAGLL